MMVIQKWKYYVGTSHFKITKEGGLLGHKEGYWVLTLDEEFTLQDGLQHMGDLNYELVGIQAANLKTGGSGWYQPSYFYIFKRPL